jgi:hypothetical protein
MDKRSGAASCRIRSECPEFVAQLLALAAHLARCAERLRGVEDGEARCPIVAVIVAEGAHTSCTDHPRLLLRQNFSRHGNFTSSGARSQC